MHAQQQVGLSADFECREAEGSSQQSSGSAAWFSILWIAAELEDGMKAQWACSIGSKTAKSNASTTCARWATLIQPVTPEMTSKNGIREHRIGVQSTSIQFSISDHDYSPYPAPSGPPAPSQPLARTLPSGLEPHDPRSSSHPPGRAKTPYLGARARGHAKVPRQSMLQLQRPSPNASIISLQIA